MKTWGLAMWVLFAFLMVLLASILYTAGTQYYALGLIPFYFMWATIIYTVLKLNTIKQKANNKVIHIHHYFLALVMMSF